LLPSNYYQLFEEKGLDCGCLRARGERFLKEISDLKFKMYPSKPAAAPASSTSNSSDRFNINPGYYNMLVCNRGGGFKIENGPFLDTILRRLLP